MAVVFCRPAAAKAEAGFEGKREEDVCGQLGDVKKLAREIIMSGKVIKCARLRDIANKINNAFENAMLTKVISLLPLASGIVLWILYKGWIFWKCLPVWAELQATSNGNIMDELVYMGLPTTGNIYFFISIFITLSVLCLIWSFRTASPARIFRMVFYIGVCVSLGCLNGLLKTLSAPYLFFQLFFVTMIPLLCGTIVSAVLFFCMNFAKKRVMQQ